MFLNGFEAFLRVSKVFKPLLMGFNGFEGFLTVATGLEAFLSILGRF